MAFRKCVFIVGLLMVAVLSGCGGTSFVYTDSKEEKPGPGLLSGDDGVFTVLHKKKGATTGQDSSEVGTQ